jgi:hypothetical protein
MKKATPSKKTSNASQQITKQIQYWPGSYPARDDRRVRHFEEGRGQCKPCWQNASMTGATS